MSVMAALQSYGRPFFGRAAKMIVQPVCLADVTVMTGLEAEAVSSGERTFTAIASQTGGSSPLPSGTRSPLLNTLLAKRTLATDLPLSMKPDSRNKRYRTDGLPLAAHWGQDDLVRAWLPR